MPDESAPADLVLTGGRVHTVDPADRVAEAVAVRGGRITRVGTAREVAPLIGPGTRVVPLSGRSVLPGINDSHLHGVWLGAMWPNLLMDQLTSSGGHAHEAPSRLGTAADRRRAILRTADLLASLGITSYTEPGLGPGEDQGRAAASAPPPCTTTPTWRRRARSKSRVTALLLFGELDGRSSADELLAGLRDFTPPADVPGRFRVAGVKIFADGIPPMHPAWTDRPYADGSHGAPLVEAGRTATGRRPCAR